MVKIVVFSVLIVLLAMHTQINAFGLVRVDVQNDGGAAFANALGNAVSSKLQSWNSILNSLIQVKYGNVGTTGTTTTTTTTTNTGGNTAGSSTVGVNYVPYYKKIVTVNSAYAPAGPSSGQVANRIDADDSDNAVVPQNSASTVGRTIVTVNKSVISTPVTSEITSSDSSPAASGSSSSGSVAAASAPTSYTYRKRYIRN